MTFNTSGYYEQEPVDINNFKVLMNQNTPEFLLQREKVFETKYKDELKTRDNVSQLSDLRKRETGKVFLEAQKLSNYRKHYIDEDLDVFHRMQGTFMEFGYILG